MQKLAIKNANSLFHMIEDNKSASILIELEDNTKVEDEVRKEVVDLCSNFPIYKNLR